MAVVNGFKEVPHMGGKYTAFGPADPCWPKKVGQGTPATFQNSAYSSDLKAKRTTKTQIENNWLALEGTHWGPPSTSAGGDGVKSVVEDKEAWVSTGSSNLFIEGQPAARCLDPTRVNRDNSAGLVMPGFKVPLAESNEEYAKKKCQLKTWKGTSAMGAELGYTTIKKVGDPYYLELYDTDNVTFEATRHDITQKPPRENPDCEAPTEGGKKHTIWSARAWVFPFFQRERIEEEHSVDTWNVPAAWGADLWTNSEVMADLAEGNMEGAIGKMLHKLSTNDGDVISPDQPDGTGAQDYNTGGNTVATPGRGSGNKVEPFAPKNTAPGGEQLGKTENPNAVPDGHKNPSAFEGDARTLLFFAWWFIKPPEISVTATACGGSRKATLKVFPHNIIKFKLNLGVMIKAAGRKVAGAMANKKRGDAVDQANNMGDAAKDRAAIESSLNGLYGDLASGQAKQAKHGKPKGSGAKAKDKARRRRQQIQQKDIAPVKKAIEQQLDGFRETMAKYNKAQAAFNKAYASLQKAQKVLKLCEQVSDIADAPFSAKILENFKLEVKIQYKRTEDKESAMGWREYTTATMGQEWQFNLQVDPLIELDWTVYFSLLQLATFYIPGLAQALRRFRIVRVDVFFGINIGAVVGVGAKKDQHDVINLLDNAFVRLYSNPTMGIVAGAGGVDLAEFRATLPVQCTVTFLKPDTKGSLLKASFKGQITNHYRATLFPDRWYEIELFSGQIKGLRFFFKPATTEVGSLPA
jgi:hypothetical protein